ncbi:GIY-YIG nuclease family protein [Cytobacillus dafuensis]|uniref:GIY-YIG nuclease family protein n=1 Tax=Cytobacillus dafuensis TaxID=1742359 RepID=A0A5B8Z8R8_CYTDA|nr:GIY-YIG nuclease family protein [Cytobacillus dafuensis]QED49350.1 GIY-YIG nuclease family protein [Cytobacillus dafuensis]
MDRKKELKQLYKETEVEAGVYQIKNTQNGKLFVGSTRNTRTLKGKKFSLEMGTDTNKRLQEEWNQFGKDAFVFEILEVLKKKKEGFFDEKRELKKLEEKWLNQLQPYGERGYN